MLWEDNWLAHHGIPGMRWGVRRYQNADGTLTAAGKERYNRYTDQAGRAMENARQFNAWTKELEFENKTDGHPYYLYSKYEKQYSKMAVKNLEKANKLVSDKDKKDIDAIMKEAGLSTKKESKRDNGLPPELNGKSKAEIEAWKKKEREKADYDVKKWKESRALNDELKRFDKLDADQKKDLGDRVLKSISDYTKERDGVPLGIEREAALARTELWLGNQIAKKSGTDVGDSVTKENREARKRYHENLQKNAAKINERAEAVKKDIGYMQKKYPKDTPKFQQVASEYKRLRQALEKDGVWSSLRKESKQYQNDWAGVVLRDLGFNDTPANRSAIWPYIIEVWD